MQHSRSLVKVVIMLNAPIKASELSQFLYYLNISYCAALSLAEEKPEFVSVSETDKEKALKDLSVFISESKGSSHWQCSKIQGTQELLISSLSMTHLLELGFIAIPWAFALSIFIAGGKIRHKDGNLEATINASLPVIVKSIKDLLSGKLSKNNDESKSHKKGTKKISGGKKNKRGEIE